MDTETNKPMLPNRLAGWLAESPFFRRGQKLFQANVQDWNMRLSKFEKLQSGAYLILNDYARGTFPPAFSDRQKAYQAEIDYHHSLPGMTSKDVAEACMQKPFWFGKDVKRLLAEFCQVCECLQHCGIAPPAKVMELGCGHGWTTELLATMGFEMTGTTIGEDDIAYCRKRIASLEAKGLKRIMQFKASPMESVADVVGPKGYYDAVFVFEALHHAFDWRETIQSASECLKPGGWLFLFKEPNLIHTFTSYRIAILSNTHEIGMSRPKLMEQMRKCGLANVTSLTTHWHFWIKPHWLCGQKKK